jgi:hypothetical protein
MASSHESLHPMPLDANSKKILLLAQLRLLVMRCERGSRVGVTSLLKTAFLCALIEGDDA